MGAPGGRVANRLPAITAPSTAHDISTGARLCGAAVTISTAPRSTRGLAGTATPPEYPHPGDGRRYARRPTSGDTSGQARVSDREKAVVWVRALLGDHGPGASARPRRRRASRARGARPA